MYASVIKREEYILFFFKGGSSKLKGNGEEETGLELTTNGGLTSSYRTTPVTSQNKKQLTGVFRMV